MNQIIRKVSELPPRDNFLYCFIGTNRTGKSSIAREHVIRWKKSNPGKLVIGFDPQRRFRDLIDIFINPQDENWALKLHKYRNCLVILDDMKIINKDWRPAKGLADLMYFRCDWNIDIMCMFHNPKQVLDCVSDYATHYYIFKTNAELGSFKDNIPNYHLCQLASEEVNNYVAAYGKGEWKDEKGNIVSRFPHIVVDGENFKLMAYHMNKKY